MFLAHFFLLSPWKEFPSRQNDILFEFTQVYNEFELCKVSHENFTRVFLAVLAEELAHGKEQQAGNEHDEHDQAGDHGHDPSEATRIKLAFEKHMKAFKKSRRLSICFFFFYALFAYVLRLLGSRSGRCDWSPEPSSACAPVDCADPGWLAWGRHGRANRSWAFLFFFFFLTRALFFAVSQRTQLSQRKTRQFSFIKKKKCCSRCSQISHMKSFLLLKSKLLIYKPYVLSSLVRLLWWCLSKVWKIRKSI